MIIENKCSKLTILLFAYSFLLIRQDILINPAAWLGFTEKKYLFSDWDTVPGINWRCRSYGAKYSWPYSGLRADFTARRAKPKSLTTTSSGGLL